MGPMTRVKVSSMAVEMVMGLAAEVSKELMPTM